MNTQASDAQGMNLGVRFFICQLCIFNYDKTICNKSDPDTKAGIRIPPISGSYITADLSISTVQA